MEHLENIAENLIVEHLLQYLLQQIIEGELGDRSSRRPPKSSPSRLIVQKWVSV